MRRKQALGRNRQRSRLIPILAAGSAGYLFGSVHLTGLHGTDLSAAETVALRFPQSWRDAAPDGADASAATMRKAAATAGPTTSTISVATASGTRGSGADPALLNPQPMNPRPINPQMNPQPLAPLTAQSSAMQSAAKTSGDGVGAAASIASPPASTKAASAPPRRRVNDRPGYMLDDAQIASIKQRLNLTPDQERMWPAVEAALRNMTYARGPAARQRNTQVAAQVAAVDPDTVQDLKSAAVPLIMSFNAEQKDEVRNLAHVLGLDQLASQF